jgi:hypothetical protein
MELMRTLACTAHSLSSCRWKENFRSHVVTFTDVDNNDCNTILGIKYSELSPEDCKPYGDLA